MSDSIIKRMEKLIYHSGTHDSPVGGKGGTSTVASCNKLRKMQQVQSELITYAELSEELQDKNAKNTPPTPKSASDATTLDNYRTVSLKDLIAARIAQTESPDEALDQMRSHKDEQNRTLLNLDSLAASIYFWSPYSPWKKEGRKDKLGKSQGRTFALTNRLEDKNPPKKKDIFINFSQPALIMVAKNPETPSSTLKWLAAHHSPDVRKTVAQNENIDDETMILLAQDCDETVQIAVLDNPRISKELAVKMANSKNFEISSKARSAYYQLDMKAKKPTSAPHAEHRADDMIKNERQFLKAVADSADSSKRILAKSPKLSSDWHIRMLVAGDPNATAEILWQLASHPISQVKRKLVDKYNCLLETMVNLKGSRKITGENGLSASSAATFNTLAASATETIN